MCSSKISKKQEKCHKDSDVGKFGGAEGAVVFLFCFVIVAVPLGPGIYSNLKTIVNSLYLLNEE